MSDEVDSEVEGKGLVGENRKVIQRSVKVVQNFERGTAWIIGRETPM
jgi:hypothetical protein